MSTMTISDPRFDTEYQMGEEPPRRRSKWMPCLIGCAILLGLVVLVGAVLVYWVVQNWSGLFAMGAEQVLHEAIDETELAAAEKAELKAEVRRVTDEIRAGRLTMEQVGQIVEGVTESPLLTLFVVTAVERRYLDRSGLAEEEKTDGRRQLQRFVRGAADGKIGQPGIDAVMTHIADKQADGSWELDDRVSDAELRAAIAEAKAQADQAGVAEEPEAFDPSAELRRVIDEALGQVPEDAPPEDQAEMPEAVEAPPVEREPFEPE